MYDEATLLQGVRAQDPDALAEVHRQFHAPLYRHLFFRVHDAPTAEDLTSEVFVRLLDALQRKRAPEVTLRGWLYGVAGHVLKEHYRRSKRASVTTLHEAMPEADKTPAQQVESTLQQEKLAHVMKRLTQEQQAVLALRFGRGLPIRSVAEQLGKSEGAVKTMQARAIASLSRMMNRNERKLAQSNTNSGHSSLQNQAITA